MYLQSGIGWGGGYGWHHWHGGHPHSYYQVHRGASRRQQYVGTVGSRAVTRRRLRAVERSFVAVRAVERSLVTLAAEVVVAVAVPRAAAEAVAVAVPRAAAEVVPRAATQ